MYCKSAQARWQKKVRKHDGKRRLVSVTESEAKQVVENSHLWLKIVSLQKNREKNMVNFRGIRVLV